MAARTRTMLSALAMVALGACEGNARVVTAPSAAPGARPSAAPRIIGGRVVSGGKAVAGLRVLVFDPAPTAVTTDADGRFRVEGAAHPYDLAVVEPSGVRYYRGVTRDDPVVRIPRREDSAPLRAPSVHVAVDEAPPFDYSFTFTSPEISHESPFGSSAGSVVDEPRWGGRFSWRGPSRTTGRVDLLTFEAAPRPDLAVARYHGFASQSAVTLEEGRGTSLALALSSVETRAIAGRVTTPLGLLPREIAAHLTFTDAPEVSLPIYYRMIDLDKGTQTADFRIATPLLPGMPGARIELYVNSVGDSGVVSIRRHFSGGEPALEVIVPPAPRLLMPADGARDVVITDPLRWDALGEHRVFQAQVRVGVTGGLHSTGRFTYAIFTTEQEIRIPDLSAYGVPLHAGEQCDWNVYVDEDERTVDAIVTPAVPSGRSTAFRAARAAQFTTAPASPR